MSYNPRRAALPAILRGLCFRCPNCGEGRAFRGYLKVVDTCSHCGEPLGLLRADDFPPYVTIFLVGHLVVPLMLLSPLAVELLMAAWLPVALALTLFLLRPVKGGVLGLAWSLRLGDAPVRVPLGD